jgi:hypothetical protein
MIIDLGNGLLLNMETGETETIERRKGERRISDRRASDNNEDRVYLFSNKERRISQRRKEERRNGPFKRSIPTKEKIDYFLRRDGFYIH